MCKQNILEEVSHGYYMLKEQAELISDRDIVAKLVPHGIYCLISALDFHNIGTQKAFDFHMAIPHSKRVPIRPEYSIVTYKFSEKSYKSGIEYHGNIKVYSPAKTIADCFKFRNQIGLDVALEALKDVIRNKTATIAEIIDHAETCRVKNIIMPYLESLS